ncbi:hypothetical protein OIY81_459 [Cryptosporidium canis]|nr:hypothetical protein OIY81_459 [Cryptosporidium canis]
MSQIGQIFKSNCMHLCIIFATIIGFVLCSGYYDADIRSFEKARLIFSKNPAGYNLKNPEVWRLADREISVLKKENKLPVIYQGPNGRDLFVSIEILQACERLLNRIEMDSLTPQIIDSDLNIFDNKFRVGTQELGLRVAMEIQYCFLQYGPEVLEIPALENYSEKLKAWGIQKIFTDEAARRSLENVKRTVMAEEGNAGERHSRLNLVTADSGDKERYIIQTEKKQPEKRKLVTIDRGSVKDKQVRKKVEFEPKEQKRIIARPKKEIREIIRGQDKVDMTKSKAGISASQALAQTKKSGVDLIKLINQDDVSEKIRALGPEARLLLAWQSVVEAQNEFNEESDYYVKNIPHVMDSSVLYQSCPNFSLINFKNECAEVIMFRNSQISRGLLDGEPTQFFLKDGNMLITSNHIIRTAVQELCLIAHEIYLPEIMKNSEKYLERIHTIQTKGTAEYQSMGMEIEKSTKSHPSKQETSKTRLFDIYKKIMKKRGGVPYMNEKDQIWDILSDCNSGECVNEIVYRDLSYWLIPPEYLLYVIFRITSESYTDSLVILDYTAPMNDRIGNVFDSTGGNVNKICRTYLQNLASSGKADLIVGGIYSNLDNLLQELCRDVEQEVSKNESLLSDKRLLIGILYELELAFCGVLGVPPKGRSTEGFDAKSELDYLASGPVNLARDVWAIEECGVVSQSQLNYLLCFGSFAQGFISYLFTNSVESVVPITLLCRTLMSMEKDMKDPYNPSEFGKYLSNMLFKENLQGLFPFSSENSSKAKKITSKFFVELSNQFKMNLEKNMYINPKNTIDSIEAIYSERVCSAPLFAFLPFDLNIFPIDVKLISELTPYGCRANTGVTLIPGNMQPCIGIQPNIINYLHVLAAIIESFTNHYIDPKKLETKNIEIPVNSLCLWWKHPVNYPLNVVLADILPFIKSPEVSEYILRYSLMMESMNFPGPVKAEKRIEYIYLNPQIYSNRARDLPKNIIYPDFNPPKNVFDILEYYLRKDVIIEYRNLENELENRSEEQSNYETISKRCPDLESWQINFAIAFQNSVTKVLKMVLSKLNEPTQFKIDIDILCRWVKDNFPNDADKDTLIDVNKAGLSLEIEANGSIPWMQPSVGAYLLSTFNVWSQTSYALKIGGVSKARMLDRYQIQLDEIKYLFENNVKTIIKSNQEPKIFGLESLNPITRLKFNPYVDDTLSLPTPALESECDAPWVANLMNAFRIYFLEFQRKFIDPVFHGSFDPISICEIIKEIVKKKAFRSGFGDIFYSLFKDKKWIKNKQLVRVLVKNAGDWILQTFELPSYPTYVIQNDENLIECYKLSYSMENRPISQTIRVEIDEVEKELLPLLEITTFPTLSLKSITSFIRSTDPNTYYKSVEHCTSLMEFEIRMLVSLSSYLETISKSIFNSQVPQDSTKKGLLEELKYEYPVEAMCNWWKTVKKVGASPNYSENKVCWASLLSKHVIDFHNERVKSDPEFAMQWKPWFTAPVAEALLFGFFNSINQNSQSVHKTILMNKVEDGFIDQREIRNLEVLEFIFSTNGNYKYVTPFHRSVSDLNSMPLSYFSYLHLPSEHYDTIKEYVQNEYKRPIGHFEIMTGRALHQIEINRSAFIAYSISKQSALSKGNHWKMSANSVMDTFKEYKTSDLSLKSWLKFLQLSVSNTSPSIQSAFMLFTSYLKEEAKIIKANISENNLRSEYWTQIDNFFSLPLNADMKFSPNPPSGHFPIFEINQELDFTTIKLPNLGQSKPAPLMKFSRFRGRYWRSKFFSQGKESFLDDAPEAIPSVWPSIGKVVEPEKSAKTDNNNVNEPDVKILITSELEVRSKFNCDGLFAWQVNRAAYWAGMLQRYINKGSRLLKDYKELIKDISRLWNIKLNRKLPKVTNTDKRNQSFNIFDMCFFYKVLNFFHNDLNGHRNGVQQSSNSWEDLLENLPFFTINIFSQLFLEHYKNLSFTHIVLFFYEVVLEEKRIISLKTKHNGIFATEKDKLKAIYHAPLFSEPKEYIYPGIFFELEPPLPCSWDRVKKIDYTILPVISTQSDSIGSISNMIYLYGQPRSDIKLRDIHEINNAFLELTQKNTIPELLNTHLNSLNPKVTEILSKKLPLSGFDLLRRIKNEENSGISSKSIIWNQISSTYTNGLDWFVKHSPLALESTFLSSINIVETINQILKRELAGTSKNTEYFHDPSILPNIFPLTRTLDVLSQGNSKIAENLSKVCALYLSNVSPLSIMNNDLKLYENSAQSGYSEYICNEVANIWEPNLPFLLREIREIFLMEFIRSIKQADAKLGSKLIWPSTSTSFITADWQNFSEKSDYNEPLKSNSFVGFYNFHYFWDPALLLNVFYSQSESLDIYFEEEFINHVILEISQTPLVELGSWISIMHSPLYSTNKLITHNTIKKLLISQISNIKVIDFKNLMDIKISENDISTLYQYCFNWVSQLSIFSKEEIVKFCNEIEQKYGKTMIYMYSKSHQFEFIFNSLLLLVEKHPPSEYSNHLKMQKIINYDIEKMFNDAIYSSGIPAYTKVRAMSKNIETFVYIDPEMVNYPFLRHAPLEMHRDMQRKGLSIYSRWLFMNKYVISYAFEDALHFVRLKSTIRMNLEVNQSTSLADLEALCIDWVNLHSNEIIVLNPEVDQIFEHSVSIVDYPEDFDGVFTISVAKERAKNLEKRICETFKDLISVNHSLFSSKSRDKMLSKFINSISAIPRMNLNDSIIGWYTISNIVGIWAKDYSLNIGPHIYSNLIAKLSIKNQKDLENYSISDFYQDTGINRIKFFYNLESFLKMVTDSAYEIGYLLVATSIPMDNLVPSEAERIKLSNIILDCTNIISSSFEKKDILIKILGNDLTIKSQIINIKKVSQSICENMTASNKKMLRNFVESKSNRYQAIKDLHSRIISINKEVGSTSFSFI